MTGYLLAVAPLVLLAAGAWINVDRRVGAGLAVAAVGVLLLAVADARVCVRLGADALVAENRWTRVRVPWGEAVKVEVVRPAHTKGSRVRASLLTRSGPPVALDAASLRSCLMSAEVADRLYDEVAARRTNHPGEVVRERPWGRVGLRAVGIGLLFGPFAAMVVLGFVLGR